MPNPKAPAKRATTKTKTPAEKRSTGGRPPILTDTLTDTIVAHLSRGCYIEEAAAAAGVAKRSVYNWQREGARLDRRLNDPADELTPSKLTAHQARLVRFLHAVEAAEDEWFARANATLDQLAFGGIENETVTVETDASGNVTRKVVKKERLLPNPAVLEWRMERKRPSVYGRRQPLEVNLGGQADNPIRVEAEITPDVLLGKLRAMDGTEAG